MSDLLWAIVWLVVGATFSETIRLFIRRITKGRFFGPVPDPKTDATQKDS